MITLPPPPREIKDDLQWRQWIETLWRYVSHSVQTSGDENATIASGTTYHGVTALTAPRTLTLPASSDLTDGDEILIQDESGSAGAQTITIQRAGSDTVNGSTSVTITSNYGRRRIIKRGSGTYFSA